MKKITDKKPSVGDRVDATMNGKDWFSGIFCGEIDLFVPYGVRLDDGELRYFAHIQAIDAAIRSERGRGKGDIK